MTVVSRPLAAATRQRYTIPGYPGVHHPGSIPTTTPAEKERVMAGAEFGKVEVDIVYCVP